MCAYLTLAIAIGARTEEIPPLVGHNGTDPTERVYRRRLRPVLRSAATAMGELLHEAG